MLSDHYRMTVNTKAKTEMMATALLEAPLGAGGASLRLIVSLP